MMNDEERDRRDEPAEQPADDASGAEPQTTEPPAEPAQQPAETDVGAGDEFESMPPASDVIDPSAEAWPTEPPAAGSGDADT